MNLRRVMRRRLFFGIRRLANFLMNVTTRHIAGARFMEMSMKQNARIVCVPTKQASERALNWLVSAITKNAYSETGNHGQFIGVKNYCNDLRLAGQLLSANIGIVSQSKDSNTKCASFTDDAGAVFYFYAASLPMAIAKCFVTMHVGAQANIPEVVLL